MNLIAAVDNKWRIGFNGKLLYHCPADMKNFKELTTQNLSGTGQNVVIMGSKTLLSFPKGEPLPNRYNIVLSFNENLRNKYKDKDNIVFVSNCDMAMGIAHEVAEDDNIWIVGGGSVYLQFFRKCKKAYITRFFDDYVKTHDINKLTTKIAYMPELSKENWSIADYSPVFKNEADGILYQYQLLYNNDFLQVK